MGGRFYSVLMLIAVAIMVSCGAKAQDKLTLMKDGVACLKIGVAISALPAQCDGLYDKITKEQVEDEMDGDYTLYTFYLNGEKMAISCDYDGSGEVLFGREVFSPNVMTEDGVYPGLAIKELFEKKGVKCDYSDGIYLYLGSYRITFDLELMTEAGMKKVNDAYAIGKDVDIVVTDFKPSAKVTSISYAKF